MDWRADIYRVSAIPVLITAVYFILFLVENDKLILKFMWTYIGPNIVKRILNKNKIRGYTFIIQYTYILKTQNKVPVINGVGSRKDKWEKIFMYT